ncbi:hypothetical protein ARAF_0078 [Arsenophonus endosymbiont of Aleurodicus floccissimus]|uniref:hypothetical protein n=1 Tax=Arsenophonus endosymbiont of Aleurodicus floccissimus TaxID=2152761 RepID=UPI000E6B4AA9|nr:hypothetical protein [Arsenophonus endosymbiont of Aleurodicus floccissimus]SPP30976.1 hypothetical protein ARAF_0078 [Arsenophonus endosymbiont of Aleurodicus floccissimus]
MSDRALLLINISGSLTEGKPQISLFSFNFSEVIMHKNPCFCQSNIHKNIIRERGNRSFTELAAKKLKAAFEDAKLRLKHRQESIRGNQ